MSPLSLLLTWLLLPSTPVVVSQASIDPVSLARHLQKIDAKMYGAFWCPHCTRQKELFGATGGELINYIECDPRGSNPQPQLCRRANIQAYPTWEIHGKQFQGTRSLEELARLSNFRPPASPEQ
jgi:hypothetical protein